MDSESETDISWMHHALAYAKQAEDKGEIPVGAIVVYENEVIGVGYNKPIALHDPTAHAEIIALRQAALKLGNYRLVNTTLYVTLEPCIMCAGAMVHARIHRLVYGAHDLRAGAVESVFNILNTPDLNHRVHWQGGILANESALLLKNFFKIRRTLKKDDTNDLQ